MKILWPPSLLFYVDKIGRTNPASVVHGAAYGFVIKIVKKYKSDKGLLAHELCHVKQFWLHGLLIHTYLYLIFKKYKLNSEAESYAKQWVVSNGDNVLKENFITRIEKGYGLSYSRDAIRDRLNKYINKIRG